MSLSTNVSLNAIMNTATSALQVNQSALRVTSNNIANINTEGYHRRTVDLSPRLTGDKLTGVSIEQIRRITDQFLSREATAATAAVGRSDTIASYFQRMQDLVGSLDGGSSLDARVGSAMTALQQLTTDPSSLARRNGALAAVTSTLSALSSMATNVQALRQDTNVQLTADIRSVNSLLSQIYSLNKDIKTAGAQGDGSSGLLDQRDRAIDQLAKYMDVRTFDQGDGRVFVSLSDGTALVSDMSAELRYPGPSAVSTATSFPSITIQRINPEAGTDVGPGTALESRLQGGELRGLIDMRDRHLPDLAEQLGQVGSALAEQLNAAHNNSTAVPAPTSLTGINTGLLAGDPLNATGTVRVAVVNAQGALVQSVSIDTSLLATVGDLVSAINTGLGGAATASFSNGVLSLASTNPAQGVAIAQDASSPALRGGRPLMQAFGLNNLISSSSPSSFATGVVSTDNHNFTAGGTVDFVLRGVNGAIASTFSVTVGGTSVNDILASLNSAAAGAATFSLDSNGAMVMTPSTANANARLEVRNDTTARGATGVSLSQFFGLGTTMRQNQAMNLSVRADIQRNPATLALAKLQVTGTSVPGDIVLGAGDNTGALALAAAATVPHSFAAAGGFAASSLSLNDYIAQVTGLQADLTNAAEVDRLSRSDVRDEILQRRGSMEGVNLDEELSNMMIYQQAYNASARIMTVVQEMYDTLIQIV